MSSIINSGTNFVSDRISTSLEAISLHSVHSPAYASQPSAAQPYMDGAKLSPIHPPDVLVLPLATVIENHARLQYFET